MMSVVLSVQPSLRNFTPKFGLTAALLAAFLLLSGCSMTEMAYDNAYWLIRNRIDAYFDLTGEQEEFVDARLKVLVRWHRYEELPRYADELARFSNAISDGMTRAELEDFFDSLNRARLRVVEKSLPDLAEFLAMVGAGQMREFDARVRESIEEDMERLSLSSEERRGQRSEDIIEALEPWFDEFTDQQKRRIHALSGALPDIFPQWMDQRKRRHNAFIQLMAGRPDVKTIRDRLHFWWTDIGASYPPEMRKARERQWNAWFNMLIEIDGLLTPAQRRHALERVAEFRDEFIRLSTIDRDSGGPLLGDSRR
jgi:Family of unknown function (DUF6279)